MAVAGATVKGRSSTDPIDPSGSARPVRSGVSVRVRIIAVVALLVALAQIGAGLVVYLIESRRIEDAVSRRIDQELLELRKLSSSVPEVETLLRTFLARNVPDDTELLVAWWDDAPRLRSTPDALADTSQFADAVRPLLDDSGSTTLQTPNDGRVLVSVQSVREPASGRVGALVIVTYLDETRGGLYGTMRTYAVVSLLSLVVVVAMAAWQSGRLLAPLRTLRETAEEIGETDPSRRLPVSGNDDITALTRTVNGMLDRLETLLVVQQQFLDNAGHELKTPLTVLRGHLELLDVDAAEELTETRDLLVDEVDRMARLVGDLILLAKSERPDFVSIHPVDLTDLTLDVLAKARGLGERNWSLDEIASVVLPVDEQRLTQALLQLCDNAVKHTTTGDTVAVGSSYDHGVARLWVRDVGPGVPTADRERIFERFGRSIIAEGDEGFGLGLSIVAAIAAAHGGRVEVEDADPTGALFVITLRRSLEAPDTEEPPWPTS